MSKPNYYNGKTITEWAQETGMNRNTLRNRLKEGWTIEEAISTSYGEMREKYKKDVYITNLAIENKMGLKTLKKRINNGMSIEEAIAFDYKKNYIGQRSGRLLAIAEIESKRDPNGRARRQLLCLCDCGNETVALAEAFASGKKKSCGCLVKEVTSKRREKDLTGQTFGRWFIEGEAFRDKLGIHWNAICICGNRGTPTTKNLLSGTSTSCGCYNRERISERERINVKGQRFYRLTVKEFVGTDEYNNCLWLCVCDCGREVITTTGRLLGGQIISCGCTKSKGECLIEDYLIEHSIKHKKGYYFSDLKLKTYLYFDFAIFDKDGKVNLVEYQGEQHYIDRGNFGKQQREVTDKMKKEYCSTNNIPLFEIRFDKDIKCEMDKIIAQVNPVLSKHNA